MAFLKTSMDSHEDATAAMNSTCLKCVVHSHYSGLLAKISLEKSSASAKNGPATATITIKPERLANLCVEQDLLYPRMCFTNWFELHRQDEHFSAPSSV